ncbi:hypothetical protein QMK19_33075 [Streptomyces sp. H10-C2]|nr:MULTISPECIES: hypothetical protein [unclassified Streptomyces]MDJ0346533.1 hypothetical protein [Streptomyces sp. PH10-H1]MDJ0374338.1 hypothetical protein [Streptomyces sp. H10-C2]
MTTTQTATTEPVPYPLVDTAWGADPLDGIPQELLERPGAMDVDTAGGCG